MRISNYDEQPSGGSVLAVFSVEMPEIPLTIHKVKVIRTKKGHLIVSLPSYSEGQPDGSKRWHSYIDFGIGHNKTFSDKVLESIQPYLK